MNVDKVLFELNKLLIKAKKKSECPVAALIVHNNRIIAKAYNKRHNSNRTIDHAEIIAITKANKKLRNWRTNECTLCVTLEPCEMCKTVIKEARIKEVYYFVKRDPNKKQHNKTNFIFIKNEDENYKRFINNYKKIIENFWENKRN